MRTTLNSLWLAGPGKSPHASNPGGGAVRHPSSRLLLEPLKDRVASDTRLTCKGTGRQFWSDPFDCKERITPSKNPNDEYDLTIARDGVVNKVSSHEMPSGVVLNSITFNDSDCTVTGDANEPFCELEDPGPKGHRHDPDPDYCCRTELWDRHPARSKPWAMPTCDLKHL